MGVNEACGSILQRSEGDAYHMCIHRGSDRRQDISPREGEIREMSRDRALLIASCRRSERDLLSNEICKDVSATTGVARLVDLLGFCRCCSGRSFQGWHWDQIRKVMLARVNMEIIKVVTQKCRKSHRWWWTALWTTMRGPRLRLLRTEQEVRSSYWISCGSEDGSGLPGNAM